MSQVWVSMEPVKDNPGWFAPTGFHTVEPETWVTRYEVPDPEQFIAHMLAYRGLPGRTLSRTDYETLCTAHHVEPRADEDLDTYAMKYGNFEMSHYHTNPANRKTGIANAIHQSRYLAVRDELELRKQQAMKPAPAPDYPEGRTLSCGHVVYYRIGVMTASMGSSCPDCYDSMSD